MTYLNIYILISHPVLNNTKPFTQSCIRGFKGLIPCPKKSHQLFFFCKGFFIKIVLVMSFHDQLIRAKRVKDMQYSLQQRVGKCIFGVHEQKTDFLPGF